MLPNGKSYVENKTTPQNRLECVKTISRRIKVQRLSCRLASLLACLCRKICRLVVSCRVGLCRVGYVATRNIWTENLLSLVYVVVLPNHVRCGIIQPCCETEYLPCQKGNAMSLMEKIKCMFDLENFQAEKELNIVLAVFGIFLLIQAIALWFQYGIIGQKLRSGKSTTKQKKLFAQKRFRNL